MCRTVGDLQDSVLFLYTKLLYLNSLILSIYEKT